VFAVWQFNSLLENGRSKSEEGSTLNRSKRQMRRTYSGHADAALKLREIKLDGDLRARRFGERLAIVNAGLCPLCNGILRCNEHVSTWWRCEHYGTTCSYQIFTA
jgi:hypothetical protein